MAPSGYAILLGAGPTTAAGIARILASPTHGNLAVALLSRSGSSSLADELAKTSEGGILKSFKTDTTRPALNKAFDEIKSWASSLPTDDPDGEKLKLKLAIYNIKHSHKTPIADETTEQFSQSLETYVTGALVSLSFLPPPHTFKRSSYLIQHATNPPILTIELLPTDHRPLPLPTPRLPFPRTPPPQARHPHLHRHPRQPPHQQRLRRLRRRPRGRAHAGAVPGP